MWMDTRANQGSGDYPLDPSIAPLSKVGLLFLVGAVRNSVMPSLILLSQHKVI